MELYSIQPNKIEFFTQHNSLEIHPGFYIYNYFISFYFRGIFQSMNVPRSLFNHTPTEGLWSYFQFGALMNKINIHIQVLLTCFHFSGVSALE